MKGGDIPFHHILYFRLGSNILWHRNLRFDKIFNSGDTLEFKNENSKKAEKLNQTTEFIITLPEMANQTIVWIFWKVVKN